MLRPGPPLCGVYSELAGTFGVHLCRADLAAEITTGFESPGNATRIGGTVEGTRGRLQAIRIRA